MNKNMESASSSIMNNPEYNLDWDSFIGNARAVKQIRVAAMSARARGAQMPHILIEGGSGNGKTTLAVLTARDLAADVKMVAGPVKASEARVLIMGMSDGDVLFWDEFHGAVTGGKSKADWILPFLQDGTIVTAAGEEQMPRITVIAATNEPAKLSEAILSRFQLRPSLDDYTQDEAEQIAVMSCDKVFGTMPHPNADVLAKVACAANSNPRLIKQVMSNLRDLAIVNNEIPEDGNYPMEETLDMLELTEDGLDKIAVAYLITLLRFPDGLGLSALNEVLAQPGGVGPTERMLQKKELIIKLKSGRMLSGAGIKRANALKNAALAASEYAPVA